MTNERNENTGLLNHQEILKDLLTLVIPFIAPAILYFSGEREDIEAVFLWPVVNWFICLFFRYLKFPKISRLNRTTIVRKQIWRHSIVVFLAMSFLALFESAMAICIQATDTPAIAWVVVFGGFYLPHIILASMSDRMLRHINVKINSEDKKIFIE